MDNSLTMTETYNKGEDYLTTITIFINGDTINKMTFYKKNEEKLCLSESNGKKYIQEPGAMLGGKILPITYISDSFFANLQYAFIIGIETTYCNGRKCYVIKGNGYERYLDKKTGLAVRNIDTSNKKITRQTDIVTDYEYKYDIVSDKDIVKPDMSEFIVTE